MKRKILLALLFAAVVFSSIAAINASEVNITDSSTDLESYDSNTLSTNNDDASRIINSENASTSNVSSVDVASTVKADNVTKYYKGSSQYSATFFDNQGNVLANSNVTVTVNSKIYNEKTNDKGVVNLNVDLPSGKYEIVAANPVTGYKLTTTFEILPTISADDFKKVAGDNKKFVAKFLKSNGKALTNTNIKFKINGKTYKVKTNSKGKASLSLKNLKKGTYKITCYNTDGSSKTYKVKVYNKVSTKLSTNYYSFLLSKSKTIKVTLTNGLGYAPNAGKIIKISINGKTYSAKTKSKGIASINIKTLVKIGKYSVTISYLKTSIKKTITIKK